jgi:hypothetical protein
MDLATVRSLIRLRLTDYLDIYYPSLNPTSLSQSARSEPIRFEGVVEQVADRVVKALHTKGGVS